MAKTVRHGHFVRPFPLKQSGSAFVCPEHLNPLLEAYRRLNGLGDAIQARLQELATDPNYTPVGRQAKIREWVKADAGPALVAARAAVAGAAEKATAIRNSLTATQIDKTDVAGALLRWQARMEMKAMNSGKLGALVVTGQLSPLYALAALEAPPEFSGLNPKQHAGLAERAIEALHPQEAEKIADIEEATTAVLEAERAVLLNLQSSSGLARHEIGEAIGDPTLSERIAAALSGDAELGQQEEEVA